MSIEKTLPVFSKLAGKAVLITKYITDGVGYFGPLICQIGNGCVQVVKPMIQDVNGNLCFSQINLDFDFPSVASVLAFEKQHAQMIFDNLNENSRIYCEEVDHVDEDRIAIVRWSNGALGAIVFWGEACYVSAIQFEGESKGEEIFNLEDAGDEQFITREAVLSALLPSPIQGEKSNSYVEIKPNWVIHPEFGFIAANDDRLSSGPD